MLTSDTSILPQETRTPVKGKGDGVKGGGDEEERAEPTTEVNGRAYHSQASQIASPSKVV
jgi:hypothetical protein